MEEGVSHPQPPPSSGESSLPDGATIAAPAPLVEEGDAAAPQAPAPDAGGGMLPASSPEAVEPGGATADVVGIAMAAVQRELAALAAAASASARRSGSGSAHGAFAGGRGGDAGRGGERHSRDARHRERPRWGGTYDSGPAATNIDQRLWEGAAAAGWRIELGPHRHNTYHAPDGSVYRRLQGVPREAPPAPKAPAAPSAPPATATASASS